MRLGVKNSKQFLYLHLLYSIVAALYLCAELLFLLYFQPLCAALYPFVVRTTAVNTNQYENLYFVSTQHQCNANESRHDNCYGSSHSSSVHFNVMKQKDYNGLCDTECATIGVFST